MAHGGTSNMTRMGSRSPIARSRSPSSSVATHSRSAPAAANVLALTSRPCP